jgi:phytoene synthase
VVAGGRARAPSREAAHAEDIDLCAREVRSHDHDRYLTVLFAPRARRGSLMALYAFNLELARIRESVREPMMGEVRLQWWREAIDGIHTGRIAARPGVRALAAASVGEGLPRHLMHRLIDGRAQDLGDAPLDDLAALREYAAATSGSLVELALHILGAADSTSREVGRDAGIAWAIAGLIRAIPFHAAVRRLYLPRSLSAAAGLDVEALFAGRSSPELRAVVERLDTVVGEHVEAARTARRSVARAAVPALIMCALIDDDRRRSHRAGFDPFLTTLGAGRVPRLARLARHAWTGRY